MEKNEGKQSFLFLNRVDNILTIRYLILVKLNACRTKEDIILNFLIVV